MANPVHETGIKPNILVVSDLHLGEELMPGISDDRRRAVEMAETAFLEFMRHHQRFRVGGRPWRLVINGDLFDFMSIQVGLSEGIAVRTPDERRLGAGRRPDAAVARMRILGNRYRAVLTQMMRFAGAGHTIDIVAGNHDLEIAWPAVWAEFERSLRIASPAGVDADAALQRFTLRRWYIYEPGVVWIEHGHQYDEACSFEYGLAPADPRTGELVLNVDYAALRHMGTAAPDIDTHGTEEWTFGGFMRYALSDGVFRFGRYFASYTRFVASLWRSRQVHRSVRVRQVRAAEHNRAMNALCAETGVSRDALDHVDALARAPMTKSARRLMRMLRIDRWLICSGVALLALAGLLLLPLWAGVIVAIAAVLAGYRATTLIGPAPAVQAAMPHIPGRIRQVIDAPVVVFGHTHEPLNLPLADGGVYLNSGTWLPAVRPGLTRSFTHVAIMRDESGAAHAQLRQWKDGQSKPFVERDPTPVPAPLSTAPARRPAPTSEPPPVPTPARSRGSGRIRAA